VEWGRLRRPGVDEKWALAPPWLSLYIWEFTFMQMTMIEALNSALALELERDQRVVLLGQDIGANGGVFRVTEHLQRKFGEE